MLTPVDISKSSSFYLSFPKHDTGIIITPSQAKCVKPWTPTAQSCLHFCHCCILQRTANRSVTPDLVFCFSRRDKSEANGPILPESKP